MTPFPRLDISLYSHLPCVNVTSYSNTSPHRHLKSSINLLRQITPDHYQTNSNDRQHRIPRVVHRQQNIHEPRPTRRMIPLLVYRPTSQSNVPRTPLSYPPQAQSESNSTLTERLDRSVRRSAGPLAKMELSEASSMRVRAESQDT